MPGPDPHSHPKSFPVLQRQSLAPLVPCFPRTKWPDSFKKDTNKNNFPFFSTRVSIMRMNRRDKYGSGGRSRPDMVTMKGY